MREILRCSVFAAVLCGLGSSCFAAGVSIDMPEDVLSRAENGMIQVNHQEQLIPGMLEADEEVGNRGEVAADARDEENQNVVNRSLHERPSSLENKLRNFCCKSFENVKRLISSKEFKDYVTGVSILVTVFGIQSLINFNHACH